VIRTLDLFAGIGGFSLGLHRAGGFTTTAFCECERQRQSVLSKNFPGVPIYDDICTLTGGVLAADGIAVDLITGGFPCQAFSNAARGRNNARDYWPEMARLVDEVRPQYVIAENVKLKPIARAADFFTGLGMQCDVIRIPANAVGADHERVRWWAVAHPHADGQFPRALHAEVAGLPQVFEGVWGAEAYRAAIRLSDGIPAGLDPAGPYGNAVVPQIVELIGRAIAAIAMPAWPKTAQRAEPRSGGSAGRKASPELNQEQSQ